MDIRSSFIDEDPYTPSLGESGGDSEGGDVGGDIKVDVGEDERRAFDIR